MGLPKIVPCGCGQQPALEETYMNKDGYFRRCYRVCCAYCGTKSSSMETRTKAIKEWNHERGHKENAPAPAGTGDERKRN